MGAFGVVFLPILRAKYSCFQQVTEDFPAQELVPERAVKAFDIAVFPRRTGPYEPRFDVQRAQVSANGPCHELRPIVAPDKGRCSPLGDQLIQDDQKIGRGNRSVDFKGKAFTGVFVDDGHPLEAPAIVSGVEEEVVAPYVVRIVGP